MIWSDGLVEHTWHVVVRKSTNNIIGVFGRDLKKRANRCAA